MRGRELADLPGGFVPRGRTGTRLEQAEKPVQTAAPAIVSHVPATITRNATFSPYKIEAQEKKPFLG